MFRAALVLTALLHGQAARIAAKHVVNVASKHVHQVSELNEDQNSKPDFSGKWKLTAMEGDPEGFLKESGVSWWKRKAARMASYGVNRVNVDLKQQVAVFEVKSSSPFGSSTAHFTVGGGEQPGKASDGGAYFINPVWGCLEFYSVACLKATVKRDGMTSRQTWFMDTNRGSNVMVIETDLKTKMIREVYTKQ